MAFSYTLHLSNKKNAVSTIANIGRCSKHNLRRYKDAKDYDFNQIEVLRGSDKNILNDVKEVYKNEFDEVLEEYNGRVRSDRKIDDYLKHVSESRSDAAAEIIIQIGDREFWGDKDQNDKKMMKRVFENQIEALEEICPNFKIASAVVHYDESSPHMHIVGVPVASGYKKGMKKQVAKTKVFTKDTLSELQDKMRVYAEIQMKSTKMEKIFQGRELKEKEKGRNADVPVVAMLRFREMEREAEEKLQVKKDELAEKEMILQAEHDEKIMGFEADVHFAEEEAKEKEQELAEKKREFEVLDSIKPTHITTKFLEKREKRSLNPLKEPEIEYVATAEQYKKLNDYLSKTSGAYNELMKQKKTIKDAKAEAEGIISDAKAEAEEILNAANEEAKPTFSRKSLKEDLEEKKYQSMYEESKKELESLKLAIKELVPEWAQKIFEKAKEKAKSMIKRMDQEL